MDKQDWDLAFDPATGLRRRQEDVAGGRILPSSRWPNFFSRVVAKLQWDEQAHRLGQTCEAFPPRFPTTAASGSRSCWPASGSPTTPSPRTSRRSAPGGQQLADRVGGLPAEAATSSATRGSSTASPPRCSSCRGRRRRSAVMPRGRSPRPGSSTSSRSSFPPCPAEMAEGRAGLNEGMALYHMTLEGMVLPPASVRCSRKWRTAPCRACVRACTTSSSTSAGTSASACAA